MFDLQIKDAVARLTLARPEARNAIPFEGWATIAAAAREAEGSGARLLVISGPPAGVFSAGADLSEFSRFHADPGARTAFRLAMREAGNVLQNLAIPVIAAIEGGCYGAGVALAMACDIRIAGSGARFAITPAKFGIAYPQEDVHRLVQLVGPGQASRLLLGAGAIDGAEAARIGLVDLYYPGGFLPNLKAFIADLLANDPESLRALKRGIGLAAAGARMDEEQDRSFEALLGSDALAKNLATRTRPR